MLNPFPSLLTFSLLAPFLIRIVIGVMFLDIARSALIRPKRAAWHIVGSGILFALAGIALVVGFFTQISALVGSLFSLVFFFSPQKITAPLSIEKRLLLVLFVASLSLLISGAGLFAFDLPL